MLAVRDRLTEVGRRHGVSLPAAALRFSMAHPAITSVVVGARTPKEVEVMLEWSAKAVPTDLWHELIAEGHLLPETTFCI